MCVDGYSYLLSYPFLYIALYDLESYIQQYSYDIDLTWIAVE